jgi:hypothetical protein
MMAESDPGSARRSGISVLFFGREPNNSGTRRFAQAFAGGLKVVDDAED